LWLGLIGRVFDDWARGTRLADFRGMSVLCALPSLIAVVLFTCILGMRPPSRKRENRLTG
jgi:hypothetical protein